MMAVRASSVPKLSSSSLSVLIFPDSPDTLYSRSPSNCILEQLQPTEREKDTKKHSSYLGKGYVFYKKTIWNMIFNTNFTKKGYMFVNNNKGIDTPKRAVSVYRILQLAWKRPLSSSGRNSSTAVSPYLLTRVWPAWSDVSLMNSDSSASP